MQTFDAIVAGAGIWGCTVARRLAEAGKRVLVLEKCAGVGGNCRCEIDPETGIEVHTYGSHIFHTSNEEVWKFVRRFTEFNDYRHCVLAKTKKIGVENRCTEEGLGSPVDAFVSNASDGIEHSSADAIGTIASTCGGESGALGERALPNAPVHSSTSTSHFNSSPIHSSTSTSNFNLVLGGRLGGYKYFDMDKSIAAALEVKI